MSDLGLFSDTTDSGPDLSAPDVGYSYVTPSDAVSNQDPSTNFIVPSSSTQSSPLYVPNPSGLGVLPSGYGSLGYSGPLDPSESLTPNSFTQASPNLFSQLFSSAGQALSTPSSAQATSLGQIFGNLASRLIQPLGQGAVNTPLTQNVQTAAVPNSITSLLSNPIVLIGGILVVFLLIRK